MLCTSRHGILNWGSRWGGSVGGEPERPLEFKWLKAACFRQTVNSLKCLLWLSLTGVDLMNCSYNYQTWGHRHYSVLVGAHARCGCAYVCVCDCVCPHPASCSTQGEGQIDRWPHQCDPPGSCALLPWEHATPSLWYLGLGERESER